VTGSITNGAATAVSAITESYVSQTVQASIAEFAIREKLADDAFAARMEKLEQRIKHIDHKVDQMMTTMQKTVIDTLTAEDGILAKQDKKIGHIESLIQQLVVSIDTVLDCQQASSKHASSPIRKLRRTGEASEDDVDAHLELSQMNIEAAPPDSPKPNRQ
jgi:DNA repair exonuclease SbcCD ATPase subunit